MVVPRPGSGKRRGLKVPDLEVQAFAQPGTLVKCLRGRYGVPETTGGLERAAGACVNLHMIYPALVYGFWHVIGASQIQDLIPVTVPGPVGDHALRRNGELGAELQRYHDALARLSEREDIRAAPSRYEACGLRRTTERKVWNRESPLLADTTVQDDLFAAMTPRCGRA